MRIDIAATLREYADDLVEAGIPATADPNHLRIPGVLVQAVNVDLNVLGPGYSLAAQLVLVAPDNGAMRSLDTLSGLLSDLTDAIGYPQDLITPSVYQPPQRGGHTPAPLPALVFPVTLHQIP